MPFHLPKPLFTRTELWYHGLSIPVLFPVGNYLFLGERYFTDPAVFGWATLQGALLYGSSLIVLMAVVKGIFQRYPGVRQVHQRYTLTLLAVTLLSVGSVVLATWLFSLFPVYQLYNNPSTVDGGTVAPPKMTIPVALHRPRLQPTNQFRWQLLVLLPWFIPVVAYVLLVPPDGSTWQTFVKSGGLIRSLLLACQLLLGGLTARITARYPGLQQSGQRLGLLLGTYMTVTPVFVLGAVWGYAYVHRLGYVLQSGMLLRILLINVGANMLSAVAFESLYSLTKWREDMLEKELLKKPPCKVSTKASRIR